MVEGDIDITYRLGSPPDDELAFEVVVDTSVNGNAEERAVVLRVATVDSAEHARRLAAKEREPNIYNLRFASPLQARRLASALEMMVDKIEGRAPKVAD